MRKGRKKKRAARREAPRAAQKILKQAARPTMKSALVRLLGFAMLAALTATSVALVQVRRRANEDRQAYLEARKAAIGI